MRPVWSRDRRGAHGRRSTSRPFPSPACSGRSIAPARARTVSGSPSRAGSSSLPPSRSTAGCGSSIRTRTISASPTMTTATNFVAPRIGASFQFTPDQTLRVTWLTGFRVPTINELYRSFRVGNTLTQANADLGPEKSWRAGSRLHGAAGTLVGARDLLRDAPRRRDLQPHALVHAGADPRACAPTATCAPSARSSSSRRGSRASSP